MRNDLDLDRVSKKFGDVTAVSQVSVTIPQGEFFSFRMPWPHPRENAATRHFNRPGRPALQRDPALHSGVMHAANFVGRLRHSGGAIEFMFALQGGQSVDELRERDRSEIPPG